MFHCTPSSERPLVNEIIGDLFSITPNTRLIWDGTVFNFFITQGVPGMVMITLSCHCSLQEGDAIL